MVRRQLTTDLGLAVDNDSKNCEEIGLDTNIAFKNVSLRFCKVNVIL